MFGMKASAACELSEIDGGRGLHGLRVNDDEAHCCWG